VWNSAHAAQFHPHRVVCLLGSTVLISVRSIARLLLLSTKDDGVSHTSEQLSTIQIDCFIVPLLSRSEMSLAGIRSRPRTLWICTFKDTGLQDHSCRNGWGHLGGRMRPPVRDVTRRQWYLRHWRRPRLLQLARQGSHDALSGRWARWTAFWSVRENQVRTLGPGAGIEVDFLDGRVQLLLTRVPTQGMPTSCIKRSIAWYCVHRVERALASHCGAMTPG